MTHPNTSRTDLPLPLAEHVAWLVYQFGGNGHGTHARLTHARRDTWLPMTSSSFPFPA
jgi:hypothetical protein